MAQQQAPIQPVIGTLDEALAIGQQADAENNNAAPLPAAPALEANVSLDFGHPFYHLYSSNVVPPRAASLVSCLWICFNLSERVFLLLLRTRRDLFQN